MLKRVLTHVPYLACLMLVFGIACESEPIGTLTLQNAQAVIESQWNRADLGILLGDIKFVEGRTNAEKGQESLSELPLYRAMAKLGVITITGETELRGTGEDAGATELYRQGVRRLARISATEQGRATGAIVQVGNFQELFLSLVPARVQTITASDSIVAGRRQYRAFTGTHALNVPPELKEVLEQTRGSMEPERRFRVLLKHNAIKDEWTVDAMDLAPASKEFTTKNVETRLGQLRNCKTEDCT
jgi:hypothetical protein